MIASDSKNNAGPFYLLASLRPGKIPGDSKDGKFKKGAPAVGESVHSAPPPSGSAPRGDCQDTQTHGHCSRHLHALPPGEARMEAAPGDRQQRKAIASVLGCAGSAAGVCYIYALGSASIFYHLIFIFVEAEEGGTRRQRRPRTGSCSNCSNRRGRPRQKPGT